MSIQIDNGLIRATFDEKTGAWQSLQYLGDKASILHKVAPPFDLWIDGQPFFGSRRAVGAVRWHDDGRAVTLCFEQEGLRITHTVTLDTDRPILRQRVDVHCMDGRAPRLLSEVIYRLPGFVIGDPADCLYQAPGQSMPIDTPYAAIAGQCEVDLSPAPCHTSGVVAVENRTLARVASAWLYSDQAVAMPVVRGDGTLICIEHRHQPAMWLRPGASVTSEGHTVLITEGALDEHLAQFRQAAYVGRLASAADVPAWFREARIFQIAPYPLSDWTPRLAELREMGFNLIYLCPVQAGRWYVVYDHFGINPEVGTAKELIAFVDQAHDLGLRVILDFIPQGVGDSSPFIEQHPDWLVRDALGRTFGSHGWGPRAGAPNNGHTLSLDWGNPEYRRFAVDWAMWYVETFDIDGFRCDAMHWKEPNLALDNPRPAWQTIYGGVRILEDLRARLKACKPDAVLLSEVWGPIFQPSTDGSYENGHTMNQLNRGWLGMSDKPLMTAAQYRDYLIYTAAARPEGYLRANFTANHDMQAIAREACRNPLGNALSLVHAFAQGIPFVTWLEIEGREAFFTALMRHRAALDGYTCSYTAAETEDQDLFLALWRKAEQPPVLAISNLSLDRTRAKVRLPEQSHSPHVILGEGISVRPGKDGIEVDLPGAGYALIRLD